MSQVALVSLIVSVLGTAILVLALGNHLGRRAQTIIAVRVALALGVPSFVVGLGTFFVFEFHPLEAPRMASGAAAIAGLTLLVAQALRARAPSRIRRVMFELAHGETKGVPRLIEDLPRLRPSAPLDRPYRGAWVPLMLEASARLITHARYAEAARLCDEIPQAWLTDLQSTHKGSTLAIARMRLGDLPAARAAIERAPVPARHTDRAVLETSRAMLLLLEGKPNDALGIAGDDTWIDERTRVAILVTRAHAHAELGDEAAARTALDRIRSAVGNAGLAAALNANPGAAKKLTSG